MTRLFSVFCKLNFNKLLINNGQGSVGYANYMDKDFIGTMDICIAYSSNLDKYVGLFLSAIFTINRYKYNFGRKWNGDRLLNSEIMLPVILNKDGVPLLNCELKYTPDYEYMRNFIKTLPFSKEL